MEDPGADPNLELSPEARNAVHKQKNAQQAIEIARESQIAEMVAQTAEQTRKAVLEGLNAIFKPADDTDPEHMKIIYGKIPILCIRMDNVDRNIEKINKTLQWIAGLIIGAVVLGFTGVVVNAIIQAIQVAPK